MSRRRMIASIAAAGGLSRLAPFLPGALQAGQLPPKRILCVFSPMGYLENSFWPSGSGTSFKLGETMTALEPWKRHLLYLDGLALYGAQYYFANNDNQHGTGAAMLFTGAKQKEYASGPSIDQAIADVQQQRASTRLHSLTLGVNCGEASGHSSVFYRKALTPVVPQKNPRLAFDLLFSEFVKPAKNSSAITRQGSALNLVKGDLERIRRLAGMRGAMQFDALLEHVSSLETKLDLLFPTGGARPTTGCDKPTFTAPVTLEDTVHAQMDLVVAAFACDMTRSAGLQLGMPDGGLDVIPGIPQDSVPANIGEFGGRRQVDLDNHKTFDRWFAARWAYLLGKLDAVPEGNGTMLDNTLVFFGSDTTTLQNLGTGAHFQERMPLWLAGGRNFAFKTGRTIKLPSPNVLPKSKEDLAQWVPHHRLLTSICNAFGLGVNSFGDNDPGKGPLLQLTRV